MIERLGYPQRISASKGRGGDSDDVDKSDDVLSYKWHPIHKSFYERLGRFQVNCFIIFFRC